MTPIRRCIEVLPADEIPGIHDRLIVITSKGKLQKRPRRIGFTVKETIGVAIVNPRGVMKASKSTIIK